MIFRWEGRLACQSYRNDRNLPLRKTGIEIPVYIWTKSRITLSARLMLIDTIVDKFCTASS